MRTSDGGHQAALVEANVCQVLTLQVCNQLVFSGLHRIHCIQLHSQQISRVLTAVTLKTTCFALSDGTR